MGPISQRRFQKQITEWSHIVAEAYLNGRQDDEHIRRLDAELDKYFSTQPDWDEDEIQYMANRNVEAA